MTEYVTKKDIAAITKIPMRRLNTAFSQLRRAKKEPAYSLAKRRELINNKGYYDPAVIPHLVEWHETTKARKSVRPKMSISRVEPPREVKLTPEQKANNAAILARLENERRQMMADCKAMQASTMKTRGISGENGRKPRKTNVL